MSRPHLQKLFAAITEEKADGGIFVTTAAFTGDALEYGKKYGIETIDVNQLIELMKKAYPESKEKDLQEGIRVMCACGDVVTFHPPDDTSKKFCKHGHEVHNHLKI